MPNNGGQTSDEKKKATEGDDRSLSTFDNEGQKDQQSEMEQDRRSSRNYVLGFLIALFVATVATIIILVKPRSSEGEQKDGGGNLLTDEETVLPPRPPPACMEADGGNPYPSGIRCEPCTNELDDSCVLYVKVNLFASETGYFEVEGCDGVNPTLLLAFNKTYVFDQSDESNHFNLIGFAYEADGSHVPVDELEPAVVPHGSGSDCDETYSCPAAMYWRNGEYQGKYSNDPSLVPIPEGGSEDFGVDNVEPLFHHPIGDWVEYGPFKTTLRFDEVNFRNDFFYFSHIFPGMSGRIKLLDSEGNLVSEEDKPKLPYAYALISPFDADCGTFDTTDYCDPTYLDQCPDSFICGNEMKSPFAECTEAANCRMISSITTRNVADLSFSSTTTNAAKVADLVLFYRQMIAHMQNTNNIMKAFLKIKNPGCYSPAEEYQSWWECALSGMLREIVNTQLAQIFELREDLESYYDPELTNCSIPLNLGVPENVGRSIMDEESNDSSVFESGIACDPCAGRDETVCEIKVKVNQFAGEFGYFEIEGCAGVSPTIYLTVGRTYLFDQSDFSNWYHLIGFAYEADGWHIPVDELDPHIAPPGSGSDCGKTLSCPAPMYWRDNEYQGNYSNAPNLVPIPKGGSDDYGVDNVEYLFKHPLGDWESYGPFATTLTFDVESFDSDIFYYNTINAGMSGRIKLRDTEGNLLSPKDSPELPYAYDSVSPKDKSCGTFGLGGDGTTRTGSDCPASFVCDGEGDKSSYANCMDSVNCAMLHDVASSNDSVDDTVLFVRQMIALKRNAVNMAKAVLKSGAFDSNLCWNNRRLSPYPPTVCWLRWVVYEIIHQQNDHVNFFQMGLDHLGVEESDDCSF